MRRRAIRITTMENFKNTGVGGQWVGEGASGMKGKFWVKKKQRLIIKGTVKMVVQLLVMYRVVNVDSTMFNSFLI